VPERSQVLARNLASLPEERGRKNRRARTFKSDRTLQMLVADLVAARTAAGMTQEEVAVRMWTTKSVVSRLESGMCTRPTLTTIGRLSTIMPALQARHRNSCQRPQPCYRAKRRSRRVDRSSMVRSSRADLLDLFLHCPLCHALLLGAIFNFVGLHRRHPSQNRDRLASFCRRAWLHFEWSTA
jgi:transcriptional regulator with XRE-family HTH domain